MNPEHEEFIRNISKQAGADAEDLYQHLWAQWLSAGDTFQRYSENGQDGKILVTLQRWARDFLRKEEEAQAVGHEDRYWYSRAELKQLIPFVEAPEHWSNLAVRGIDGELRSRSDPALLGTALAVWSDMRTAWGVLSEQERWLLRERFVNPQPTEYEELAEVAGKSAAAVRKEVERAISKMQRALGGARRQRLSEASGGEVSGSRRAVSNAAAQGYTRRVWDG